MTRPISTAPATPKPLPAPVAPPVEPAKPPAAAPRADRLDLGNSRRSPLLEADLRLKLITGPAFVANGQVSLNRQFVERLVHHALSKSDMLAQTQVSFDPTRQAYSVRAAATVAGMTVPFTVDLKPEVIGQGIGFKLDNLRIPLGESGRFGIQHRWLTGKVSEELAKELSWSLGAKAHPEQGVVTLNPNAILHHIGALPRNLGIDLGKTELRTAISAEGNLTLGMRGADMAPAANASPQSDLTVEADAAGLQALLSRVLAPDFEVGKVTLREGGAVIGGQAEFKDGSALINAGKLLTALIGMHAGEPQAANLMNERTRLMIPLDLDVSFAGTELRVKPSHDKALGEIAKTFEAAGLKPIRAGNQLRVDLSTLLQDQGALEGLQIRPDGLQVRAKLDLDAFISPGLKGDAGGR